MLVDRWRGVYEVDIMSGVAPGLAHNVLGGQISAWGEAVITQANNQSSPSAMSCDTKRESEPALLECTCNVCR